MSDVKQNKPSAVVFYARDFLATEFSLMGKSLVGYQRLYIVVSAQEHARVQSLDPEGKIFTLGAQAPSDQGLAAAEVGVGYNNDRYLRRYSAVEIKAVVSVVASLCEAILLEYRVEFYIDEPVSGFPNLHFNTRFTAAGATCLHFQTSWIPGYMFFSRDAAHADIVPLNQSGDGVEITRRHIESRLSGGALPLYVINYSSPLARIRDIARTLLKAAYRKLRRNGAYYLDRDVSAHLIHARALLGSFCGGYASKRLLADLRGKYIIYPLHYEPESILNYFSEFNRQQEIVEQIIDSLPLGYELILKEHPSQPGALNMPSWRGVTQCRRVIKIRGEVNARALLKYDVAVVSIGSTLAIEAALAGRPVGVLGKVHFAGMPGITPLSSPRDLNQLLSAPPSQRQQIEHWYGNFLDTHCFQGNIMKSKTTPVDMRRIFSQVRAGAGSDEET